MVILSRILFEAKPRRIPRAYLRTRFIDSVRLHVKGGTGGAGLPRYGGIGGQGGCVYCVGAQVQDLRSVTKAYPKRQAYAGHGEDSCRKRIVGAPGTDKKIEVPLGVRFYSEPEGNLLGEINEEGETCIVARGGPGGSSENGFLGHTGQNYHVRLDLRLIADVGLVGFPNAGKSSLLKAVSRVKPRIANYPFTTMKPRIGTMEYADKRQITMADLPGLIEGAHINVGLGHKFLKHVERTKILLLIADIQGFSLSVMHPKRTCLETIVLLNKELELYNEELLDKPALLAINKMDLPGAKEQFEELKVALSNLDEAVKTMPEEFRPDRFIQFDDIIGISALNADASTEYLKDLIRRRLDQYSEAQNPDMEEPNKLFRRNTAKVRERGPKIT